jgi:hypothetical protein
MRSSSSSSSSSSREGPTILWSIGSNKQRIQNALLLLTESLDKTMTEKVLSNKTLLRENIMRTSKKSFFIYKSG